MRDDTRDDMRGYVAASIGTLVGGLVGLSVGQLIGFPLAARAAESPTDGRDTDGFEEALQAIGAGLGRLVLAALAFALAVLLVIWVGVVGGCWLALRIAGAGRAVRTALWAGSLGLPIAFLTVWAAQLAIASQSMTAAYVTYGAAAVATALAARRFTAPSRRPPAPPPER